MLITMLADDRAVQDVIFEPGAVIESLPEGSGPYLDEYHQRGSFSQTGQVARG